MCPLENGALLIDCFEFVSYASGPFQMSNFTCAKSNANEKNLLFSLISIRFGTCKVRRLKRASDTGQAWGGDFDIFISKKFKSPPGGK